MAIAAPGKPYHQHVLANDKQMYVVPRRVSSRVIVQLILRRKPVAMSDMPCPENSDAPRNRRRLHVS